MDSSSELVTASEVRAVAVIGAGTMGHGIAQIAAHSGATVVVTDAHAASLAAVVERIGKNLAGGVKRGKLTEAERDATLARISTADSVEACVEGADLVVEAVPERIELKRDIFQRVDGAAPARAVLASNTSSLPIADIASSVANPGRVVGMHFFNPVHIMKLVEVVRHADCAPAAVDCAVAVAEAWGKTPIRVNDAPGFASSRLGLVLGLEAIRMVEQGVAEPADIDTAMKLGYGHPMGPLELTDLVGLDVRHSIAEYLATELGEHFRPPELLSRMVEDGTLGKKTGKGFYTWVDGKKA